jgi:hypothetical protein
MSTKVSSNHQSGGVTAHTVNVAGGVQSGGVDAQKPRSIWWRAGAWAVGVVGLVASVSGIFDYFGIKPWEMGP